MVKKLAVLSLAIFITVPLFAINGIKDGKFKIKQTMNDISRDSKTPYSGGISDYFDKSANGYGWYQGYNRKIAWNADPTTGPMLGSIYRRLNPATGSGTVGGMIGDWTGADLLFNSQVIYDTSDHWDAPGGRYPYVCGFINGYFFGVFNDFEGDNAALSYPKFAIADATWGYNFSSWDVGEVAATDGGAIVPAAWTGSGDVVYSNPAQGGDGYYYWSQAWNEDLVGLGDFILSCPIGRSMTPGVASSWEWTDYNDLRFDTADDTNGMIEMNDISWSYCKDLYGNGTGYGIAVTMGNDTDDFVMVDSSQVQLSPRICYMYTTNWGADNSSGDFAPNWKYDTSHGDARWFQIDPKNLFDWYGSTLTEIDDTVTPPDTLVTVMNDPFITWNISSVATEYNAVHLIIRAFAGTYEGDYAGYLLYDNDEDFVAGYYHVRGLITDTGVVWSPAHLIAHTVGLPENDIEWVWSNFNVLSIGYAGFGQIYASWLDRPRGNRNTLNEWPEPDTVYWDDAFFSISGNDGDSWEYDEIVEIDTMSYNPGHVYDLVYATNITMTGTLHEEGWAVSTHGQVVDGQIEMYAASQYYDAANPLAPPVNSFFDHQQFLHAWKITGTMTDGIESERVSLTQDFELMQNYPNPFNPTTEISFNIKNDSRVKLTVFNSNGEQVMSLVDGKMAKGLHKVNFDATQLNSGVYFYQLDVNGMMETKKMVLAK